MTRISLLDFWRPPKSSSYEQTQKARLVHVMLMAAFAGGLVIGIANLSQGWKTETALLFLLAGVCWVGFYVNRSGYYDLAAFILCASLFFIIGALMYYGIALHDESVMAYPIFILCAAFLFRRRGLVIATILSIASIVFIFYLETHGVRITSRYHDTVYRVIILAFLFVILGAVTWVIRATWISHLVELQKSYDLTLLGWAKALEYKDGETAGHSRRVTELCLALARKLGCSEDEILQMRRGAYLHDIGKMAIPDAILLKNGPLTDEEWQIMKRHPVLAVDFISNIPYLKPALSIPYSHHERWDGSGYPEGLKGDAIPLAARIFTIVDQWDALNSDRPYRKAWSQEKTITYLQENAGKIFDPQITDAFIALIHEGKIDIKS